MKRSNAFQPAELVLVPKVSAVAAGLAYLVPDHPDRLLRKRLTRHHRDERVTATTCESCAAVPR